MRTFLEQPMRRSDFIKLGFAVAGAFFLCPYHRWEGTARADAAEDSGARGGGTEETVKVYSVEKKDYVTVGKVAKTDTEWKRMLEFEQYVVTREKGTEEPYSGQYVDTRETGVYRCVCCGNDLFLSDTKYDSRTGRPEADRIAVLHQFGRPGVHQDEPDVTFTIMLLFPTKPGGVSPKPHFRSRRKLPSDLPPQGRRPRLNVVSEDDQRRKPCISLLKLHVCYGNLGLLRPI